MKITHWRINTGIGINLELTSERPTWIYLLKYVICIMPDNAWRSKLKYRGDEYKTINKHVLLHTEPFNNKKFFNLGISFSREHYKHGLLFIGRYIIN